MIRAATGGTHVPAVGRDRDSNRAVLRFGFVAADQLPVCDQSISSWRNVGPDDATSSPTWLTIGRFRAANFCSSELQFRRDPRSLPEQTEYRAFRLEADFSSGYDAKSKFRLRSLAACEVSF